MTNDFTANPVAHRASHHDYFLCGLKNIVAAQQCDASLNLTSVVDSSYLKKKQTFSHQSNRRRNPNRAFQYCGGTGKRELS
eukprot:CAMPEP_0172479326 /NCGR_PEP_ID=MMETSP1066-20121228/3869_1 /TAXON_ID=671091 /ORGANISM="Coscinodiscus wailesii, Strain CCMP2513" /LENGTH=80 /DNA_ID=CAMNT_0013239715 /DNA_START=137 /DNA_END=376 /DNA_ORIENTATION=+